MTPSPSSQPPSSHTKYPVPTNTDAFHALPPRGQAQVIVDNILNDGNHISSTQQQAIDAHVPRPSDIILNTHPKAGTVLLQQMCYQIAVHSGGHSPSDPTGLDFDDIVQVVPWVERDHFLGCGPSKITPRVYKTHMDVDAFAEISKHLVIVRNPKLFASSFLNFLYKPCNPDVNGMPDDNVIQECVDVLTQAFILKERHNNNNAKLDGLGGWHTMLKKAVLTESNRIMIVFYEDVVQDLQSTAKRIARFMECDLDSEAVSRVVRLCDRTYMANDKRFKGEYEYRALGMKTSLVHAFAKDYQGFKKKPVSPYVDEQIEAMNVRAFGLKTYDDIRQAVNAKQLEIHGY